MISITDKHNCCGCEACRQRCPHDSITMREDNEGFLYPEVDMAKCVDCGLCEKVCPIINVPNDVREPLHTYAAINPNEEIRMASSSGGIFSALAEQTIATEGVVFGARFDKDWNVEHGCADTFDDIKAFRGSKYVQSKIGNTYREAERFLKQGRNVLFSGTPCQIAGLKTFLRKDYPNLLTVDIICHGVPSPKVWQSYLSEIQDKNRREITSIFFRDKRNGWNDFGMAINGTKIAYYALKNQDPFLNGFLHNLFLRPSCHSCFHKSLKSGSDITLGDFWGYEKYSSELFDNKGLSCVLLNTQIGLNALQNANIKKLNSLYEIIIRENSALHSSIKEQSLRQKYFRNQKLTFSTAIKKVLSVSIIDRIKVRFIHLISK